MEMPTLQSSLRSGSNIVHAFLESSLNMESISAKTPIKV